jgi:hypothetical protein
MIYPSPGQFDGVTQQHDEPGMYVLDDLEQLATLLRRCEPDQELYVRWSRGPDADLTGGPRGGQTSRDALTGVVLPGLSANPLRVEPWWGDRSLRLWVARRLYDYCHIRNVRDHEASPWVFIGEQCGRGPDNEPLVICHRPLAWVSEAAIHQANLVVREQGSAEWGPLNRVE